MADPTAAHGPASGQHLGPPVGQRTVRSGGQAMGTEVHFMAWAVDGAPLQRAFAEALAEIRRLEALMTTWPHPGWLPSEIQQINAHAGDGVEVPVSADTLTVLLAAVDAGARSGGLLDVTVGPLLDLWRFTADGEPRVPEASAIAGARALVDYRQLIVDPARRTARLAKHGMGLDLGGIAKGYAVDAAVRVMRQAGFADVVVQAGGDLYAAGLRDNKPWRIGLRDPRGLLADDALGDIAVTDQAVCTAGDYERGFDLEGTRYHHILDPRTGMPSRSSRSVIVVASSARLADALDDVVFLLGADAGLTWLEGVSDAQAVVIDANGKTWVSPGLADRVTFAPVAFLGPGLQRSGEPKFSGRTAVQRGAGRQVPQAAGCPRCAPHTKLGMAPVRYAASE